MSCTVLAMPVFPVARVGWRPDLDLSLTACRRSAFGRTVLEPHPRCGNQLTSGRGAQRVSSCRPLSSGRATAQHYHPSSPSPSSSRPPRPLQSVAAFRESRGPVETTERRRRGTVVVHAVPTIVSGAVAAVVVVASVAILVTRGAKEKPEEDNPKATKPPCEACGGTGVCGTCRGEGFVAKGLSPEAQARAKARSPTAATRNTAAMPRKWNYCPDCGGGRACRPCDGRGVLEEA